MARTYETVTDTTPRTNRVLKVRTCDLCGAKARDEDNWFGDYGDVNEVEVSIKTGYRYYHSGNHTVESYDVCPKCFREKLEPWLKSQGASAPHETEVDW